MAAGALGRVSFLLDGSPGKREPWEELSFLLDIVRLYRGIGLTGDTVGCAAKHLTS
jgi:hypothetical protein